MRYLSFPILLVRGRSFLHVAALLIYDLSTSTFFIGPLFLLPLPFLMGFVVSFGSFKVYQLNLFLPSNRLITVSNYPKRRRT